MHSDYSYIIKSLREYTMKCAVSKRSVYKIKKESNFTLTF